MSYEEMDGHTPEFNGKNTVEYTLLDKMICTNKILFKFNLK